MARHSAPSSPFAITGIRVLGGEMARIPADATAFAQRDANVMFTIITPFEDIAEAPIHDAWTQEYLAALASDEPEHQAVGRRPRLSLRRSARRC